MKIQFWGATDDVTGSMTLLHLSGGQVLIDCGMTQGSEETVKKNYLTPPFVAKELKAIILTHAHLDHCGFIPKLVKDGFRGDIFCTQATMKLAMIVMMDSARLLEEGETHNKVALYSPSDVTVTSSLFKVKTFEHAFSAAGATITLRPAGHILGAASVRLQDNGETIVFSGDLGRLNDPLIPSAVRAPKADMVVMESTYGGKDRSGVLENDLHTFLVKVFEEKKVGIVASFAVARAQMLITMIHDFFERHPQFKSRLVIDSPMMKLANRVYKDFASDTKMSDQVFTAIDEVDSIDSAREWGSLKKNSGPLIIISSSGMVSGGRVFRSLENWKDDSNALLFLPGYQAEGTTGRSLMEGNRRIVDNEGKEFIWKGEIMHSEAFSSHADQSELLDWVSELDKNTHLFLLHGEESSKVALKKKLTEVGFSQISIPVRGEQFN